MINVLSFIELLPLPRLHSIGQNASIPRRPLLHCALRYHIVIVQSFTLLFLYVCVGDRAKVSHLFISKRTTLNRAIEDGLANEWL